MQSLQQMIYDVSAAAAVQRGAVKCREKILKEESDNVRQLGGWLFFIPVHIGYVNGRMRAI